VKIEPRKDDSGTTLQLGDSVQILSPGTTCKERKPAATGVIKLLDRDATVGDKQVSIAVNKTVQGLFMGSIVVGPNACKPCRAPGLVLC
jgi:hypothetical protein